MGRWALALEAEEIEKIHARVAGMLRQNAAPE
jgi:hypothetical protein